MKKEMTVSAIQDGTVIDHIPSDATLKVMQILNLGKIEDVVSVAYNLKSSSMDKKGIIKIAGKSLNKKEIDKIALIAPMCTVSIIKDYQVAEKRKLEIPDLIEDVAKCINPNCITNHEAVKTIFKVEGKQPLLVRCNYCERTMSKEELIVE